MTQFTAEGVVDVTSVGSVDVAPEIEEEFTAAVQPDVTVEPPGGGTATTATAAGVDAGRGEDVIDFLSRQVGLLDEIVDELTQSGFDVASAPGGGGGGGGGGGLPLGAGSRLAGAGAGVGTAAGAAGLIGGYGALYGELSDKGEGNYKLGGAEIGAEIAVENLDEIQAALDGFEETLSLDGFDAATTAIEQELSDPINEENIPTLQPPSDLTLKPPAESDLPALEVPSNTPTLEVPSNIPTLGLPSNIPTLGVPSNTPTLGLPSDLPTLQPPSDLTLKPPAESDLPALEVPSASDLPTLGLPSDLPALEVPSNIPTLGVPSDLPTLQAPEIPNVEVTGLSDLRSTLSELPEVSFNDSSGSSGKGGINATANPSFGAINSAGRGLPTVRQNSSRNRAVNAEPTVDASVELSADNLERKVEDAVREEVERAVPDDRQIERIVSDTVDDILSDF